MKSKYSGKNILVAGMGVSGIAVANLLKSLGAEVTVADIKSRIELLPGIRKLAKGIKVISAYGFCGSDDFMPESFDMIVASPGIHPDDKLLVAARRKSIPVTGELEISHSLLQKTARTVAVTGTNGKTTTVELIKNMLEAQKGRKGIAAGNIGLPLSAGLEKINDKVDVVIEVSSYQLETTKSFHPLVSVILNITPDHLEHHGTMARYIKAKSRIFSRQAGSDFCILNADDRHCAVLAKKTKCRTIMFSRSRRLSKGIYLEADRIVCKLGFAPATEYKLTPGFVKLPGFHNLENIMVAIAVGNIFKLPKSRIKAVISSFKGVEHRLEFAGKIGGVKFINDSKATNVQSCRVALETFPENIILLMGGRDKGSSYMPLKKLIRQRVKGLVVFGESAEKIRRELKGSVKVHTVKSVKQAVSRAFSLALPGYTVLFSPACSSFDQFLNFEERGKVFKEWVRKLR